jgi:hypothetical protein
MLCFGKGFSLAVPPHGHASCQLAVGSRNLRRRAFVVTTGVRRSSGLSGGLGQSKGWRRRRPADATEDDVDPIVPILALGLNGATSLLEC